MSAIATGTALLISAGVGLATAGATIGYEASQGGGPSAPTQSQIATQQANAATAAATAQAQALTKRRGMASTQLTSPLGTSGTANVQKSTLG
jgi:hypothetical protein